MFIKDDMQDAYFESYWNDVSWDTWDLTYLVWPEIMEDRGVYVLVEA